MFLQTRKTLKYKSIRLSFLNVQKSYFSYLCCIHSKLLANCYAFAFHTCTGASSAAFSSFLATSPLCLR